MRSFVSVYIMTKMLSRAVSTIMQKDMLPNVQLFTVNQNIC
jgi:hypothetical protein